MTFRRALAPTLAVSALALAGCAGAASAPGTGEEGLSVVATTTQVADFTRQVAGDAATVTQLLQPNTTVHTFDPTAADLMALGSADVLVVNGAGLESWLDDAIEASGFAGVTIDTSEGVELHEIGEDADQHADEEHDDEHAEDEHDHVGADPHIWTSVRNASAMVDAIVEGLAEAEPDDAETFAGNGRAYRDRLEQLDAWITEQIDAVPPADRLLVSNHESLGYFVEDYGITYVGAVLPSFDDNAELSSADIDALVAEIRATGAPAVYSEASLSPQAAQTIAEEAGVRVFSGSDALYVDSLGPAGSAGATYLSAQVHNVTQLLAGWGVTPEPLPAIVTEER